MPSLYAIWHFSFSLCWHIFFLLLFLKFRQWFEFLDAYVNKLGYIHCSTFISSHQYLYTLLVSTDCIEILWTFYEGFDCSIWGQRHWAATMYHVNDLTGAYNLNAQQLHQVAELSITYSEYRVSLRTWFISGCEVVIPSVAAMRGRQSNEVFHKCPRSVTEVLWECYRSVCEVFRA